MGKLFCDTVDFVVRMKKGMRGSIMIIIHFYNIFMISGFYKTKHRK